jgi:hypothetical protein
MFQQIARKGLNIGINPRNKAREAIDWFRNNALRIRSVNRERLLRDDESTVRTIDEESIGKIYSFFYDPKLKSTLPFYDMFPLVIVIGLKSNGFLGLNMHYLPPVLRASLMDNLYQTLTDRKFDDKTKLQVNYEMLNKAARFRYFKPCLKHYLFDHVQSKFLEIKPEYWDIALMLPTESFAKMDKAKVWEDSRRQVI